MALHVSPIGESDQKEVALRTPLHTSAFSTPGEPALASQAFRPMLMSRFDTTQPVANRPRIEVKMTNGFLKLAMNG